ncbi:MAG: large conductance mechanosensitive channel protein MscL [Anaerolineales bacterium]
MLTEFKKFIMRGNVLDLAVAVVIGGAFGKIVTSFVNDILMPPIGLLLGNVDFGNLYINLSGGQYASLAEAQAAGAVTINYGLFINTVIDFLIIAFAIFLIVRAANRRKEAPQAVPAPATKTCPYCFTEIHPQATRCPHCTSPLSPGTQA